MDVYKNGSKLIVAAKNSPEFRRLIEKAEKEAQQLHKTLHELSCFDFQIRLSVEDNQAGEMDCASSAINDMPTK